MSICPNCGKLNKTGSKYCAECGSKIITDTTQQDYSDEYDPAYGKFTRKIENRLNNSNLFDKFIDTFTSDDESKLGKYDCMNLPLSRKWMETIEPVFVEVYNTIDDEYIKALFVIERMKLGGGGTMGATMLASVATPTSGLSYSESIKFYEDLLNKVKMNLKIEMKKPNFNKREYYLKKKKEYGVENMSNLGVPRHLR